MGAEHLYPPGIAIVEPRNPTSNHGAGDPATPTATFDGRRDLRRAGSIHVTPGARRLGGALRLFYGPNAGSHPHLDCFSPAFYKACGD
jgi:hypothetical protein